jgi:2-dehydropantoate 2-reductase
MRIAVMGTGGTGGFFGGLLARAGEDVTFVARGAHLDAIRRHGLTVRSRLLGDFTVAAKATDDPTEVGVVDLVLFCVKAYDNDTAIPAIRPLVGRDTMVLSVQNGIDNEELIARVVGSRAVLGAMAGVSAVIPAPGVIEHTAGGLIRFGELNGGTTPRTARLLETLRAAGIQAELHPDVRVVLWDKFVFICALSGVTALTRLSIGVIRADPETATLFRGTMEEVDVLARASHVPLPPDCVDRWWAFLASADPAIRGSMAHDLAAGRRLELETLNGTVVRLGRERGVPTPLNFAIYAALRPYVGGAPTSR